MFRYAVVNLRKKLCVTRRLRRRFELLDRYRGKKLAKLCLKAMGVLLLAMIIIVAIANAIGVVDTSVA